MAAAAIALMIGAAQRAPERPAVDEIDRMPIKKLRELAKEQRATIAWLRTENDDLRALLRKHKIAFGPPASQPDAAADLCIKATWEQAADALHFNGREYAMHIKIKNECDRTLERGEFKIELLDGDGDVVWWPHSIYHEVNDREPTDPLLTSCAPGEFDLFIIYPPEREYHRTKSVRLKWSNVRFASP